MNSKDLKSIALFFGYQSLIISPIFKGWEENSIDYNIFLRLANIPVLGSVKYAYIIYWLLSFKRYLLGKQSASWRRNRMFYCDTPRFFRILEH